jgi:2,3-bisphosphoglycerate-dependent phosphoglycerate mutase
MEDSIVIVFMRHGRSLADDEEEYEGRYDSPLTETGREQARTRAREWQAEGIRFDHIVASPLVRAAETAEIVGQALNVGFETDPNWMEVDNGPLAGRPYGDPQTQSLWRPIRNPFAPYTTTGEGESTWELHCRAIRALQRMVRRGPGQFLVVAHGGILNAALHCIVGSAFRLETQAMLGWFTIPSVTVGS